MKLKSVIHYPTTNSVEATWVDDKGIQVKCHSYAGVQMDMFRSDLGPEDSVACAQLIADVEANIKPVVPAPKPPLSVTPFQIRKALNQLGLRAAVEAAITASTDQTLKDGWEFTSAFIENDPLVTTLGLALNKTSDDIHNIFKLASTL